MVCLIRWFITSYAPSSEWRHLNNRSQTTFWCHMTPYSQGSILASRDIQTHGQNLIFSYTTCKHFHSYVMIRRFCIWVSDLPNLFLSNEKNRALRCYIRRICLFGLTGSRKRFTNCEYSAKCFVGTFPGKETVGWVLPGVPHLLPFISRGSFQEWLLTCTFSYQ